MEEFWFFTILRHLARIDCFIEYSVNVQKISLMVNSRGSEIDWTSSNSGWDNLCLWLRVWLTLSRGPTQIGNTTPGLSGPGSNGREKILHSPFSFKTVASPSNAAYVIFRTLVGRGFLPLCRYAVGNIPLLWEVILALCSLRIASCDNKE